MNLRSATHIDQAIAATLLALLLALTVATLPEWRRVWRRAPRWVALGVCLAALLALVLRMLFVAPALVHSDFQGALVIEGVLGFPQPAGAHNATYGSGYGQGSFVILGLLASLLGRTAETVVACNAALSAFATLPLAFVAARWAGNPSAGLLAAFAWASSALVARLAHSEDAHILAVCIALCAVAYAELTATARRPTLTFAGAVVAALLATWTRESMLTWGPFVLALVVERRWRDRGQGCDLAPLHRWALPLGAALLGVALALRLGRAAGASNVYAWGISALSRDLGFVAALVADHPFFQLRILSAVVGVLGLAGVCLLALRSRVRLAIAVQASGLFVLTLPAGLPSRGVGWSFRLQVYALAVLGVGVAASWLCAAGARRMGRPVGPRLTIAAACAIIVLSLLCKGTVDNIRPDASFVEYTYLRDGVGSLPAPVTLIHSSGESRYTCLAVAERLGLRVVDIHHLPSTPGPGTWVLLEGLSAHAYTMSELAGRSESGPRGIIPESARNFFVAMFDPRTDFGRALVARPTQMRPEFRTLIARSTPLGPQGPTVEVSDVIPAGLFDTARFPLRLWRWTQAPPPP